MNNTMRLKDIVSQPEWMRERCPHCYKKLKRIEILRRKLLKRCKCRYCGRIDERYVVW